MPLVTAWAWSAPRQRSGSLVLAIAVTVGLGACAATDKDDSEPKPFQPMISAAEIARLPQSSPRAAVLRLWRYGQLGSAPNIVASYHPRVQAALGANNIAGAYAVRRTTLAASRPRITSSQATAEGQLLTLRITSTLRKGKPVPAAQKLPVSFEAFLLRKDRGRWKVAHDSLLEPALVEYRLALTGGDSSSADLAAARRLAGRYRTLFLGRASG